MPANSNYRVFYPIHYVSVGYGSGQNYPIRGVQSVQLNTSFNLEQVFELGQLDIYENVENLPSIDMTITRVLDDHNLLYTAFCNAASTNTLLDRTNQTNVLTLAIFRDNLDYASGTPINTAVCSGMYVNSLSYTLPVQGTATETIGFVGNDKIWKTGGDIPTVFGSDSPGASGVQRRQHVLMGSGYSKWPTDIPGIITGGWNIETSGVFAAHIQDVNITCNLGRTDLFELGRRKPYYKYANFPTAVNVSIATTAGGDSPGDNVNADSNLVSNLSNQTIYIMLSDGTIFDLGDKNKLASVSYTGGDTGGGVVTVTYNYSNFNHLTITAPATLGN